MILAGLLPGVILSALALARQGPLEPARAASIGAYVIIAVGIPGAIGAYVLHRLLQRAV
jgi:Flp pilus assembly protein TadB